MRNIQKILIDHKTQKKHFVKDLEEDFHTSNGVISKEDLNSENSIIESNKGAKFTLLTPTFTDLWQNLNRGPQIIQQKDIGLILAKTGVGKNSKVVDAGGGSGSLCLSLANVAKEVITYEINAEHYDIIQKNIKLFGMDNLTLKQDNVYNGIDETDVDVITLDLPEPWQVLPHIEKSLKNSGHLVVYLPNISQVTKFIDATKKTKIRVIETIELLERKWKIEGLVIRPEHDMLGHTAFLVFCRKF